MAPEATVRDREPILDISAITPDRPCVRIRTEQDPDGTLYEMKLLSEFGIAEQQSLVRDGQRFDALFNKDALNGNERKALKQILDRMFEKVLLADKDVKKGCNDHVRSQVVTAFTVAPLVMAASAADQEEETEEADKVEALMTSTSES